MNSGPIVLVDDDVDDKEIFADALSDLGVTNEIIWFSNSKEAFDFLKQTSIQPFLIMCDLNLPIQTGMEFKRQIDEDPQLRTKSIPFLFYSTSVNQEAVDKAYKEITVQGFFKKGDNYEDIKTKLKLIIGYWSYCKHPNSL
jgi:CheY-like chemotaxis protein